MTPTLRPPDHDEPALLSPELRRIVDGVRAAPPPDLKLRFEAVAAGLDAHKRERRRGLGLLALAAAAVLALLALRPWALSPGTAPAQPLADARPPAPADATPTPVPAAPALAAAVRIERAEGPAPTVRDAWSVALAPGRYTLDVAAHPGADLLRVATPHGALEVQQGRVELVVAAAAAIATLQTGVAVWVAPDGQRRELAPGVPASSDMSEDPGALARRADAHLAAGERDPAIAVLRRLVEAHPDSAPARAALLDLGRLLRAAARVDEARCAYALYLARYPDKEQLADEVRAALARVGKGPACDGLRPR